MHVTTLEGPDSAGHWGYTCPCGADASGYEPDEVEAAAGAHGPLAADTPRPDLAEEDLFI